MKKHFFIILSAFVVALSATAQSVVTKENPNLKISMTDNLNFVADGKTVTYVTFYETCPNTSYSAFQIEANLPKGIEVNKVISGRKEVDDVTLNATRFEGLGHTISVGMPEDGYLKMACIDTKANDKFYNDDISGNIVPDLLVIGLIAKETAEIGDFTITLKNVKFIYQNADADLPVGQITAKATVSAAAGIENITTDATAAEYYTVDGKKLQQAQKGLNIVRMSDGSAKTVVRQ